MPLSIFLPEGSRRVVFDAKGPVGGEDLLAVHSSFLETQRDEVRRCRGWLVDFSKAETGDVESAHVRRLAELARDTSEWVPRLAVAFVAPADLDFGYARMWEALADETGWDVRVFRTSTQATSWLDEVASYS
ncbi:MAG: hypothetical protein GY937_26180 [bacterium]|nr:hypothetical protein [bacterium]